MEILIIALLSFFSVMIVRWIPPFPQEHLRYLIAFTGGFLLSVCVVHLLPELFVVTNPDISKYILIGFFIQILLDQLSAGAEHGHLHIHAEKPWQPWIILGGLCLHSILEGLPLKGHAELHGHHPTDFMAAVTLHKVPEGLILGLLLSRLSLSRFKFGAIALLFALMTPAGSLLASIWQTEPDLQLSAKLMALVVGLFLHLSTSILFEARSHAHKISVTRILVIAAGILSAYWLI